MTNGLNLTRVLLIADVVLGAGIAAWSRWRWSACGPECELFESFSGVTVLVGWYAGLGFAVISIVLLVVVHMLIINKG